MFKHLAGKVPQGCFQKLGQKPPKMDGLYWKTLLKLMIWGVKPPIFGNTHKVALTPRIFSMVCRDTACRLSHRRRASVLDKLGIPHELAGPASRVDPKRVKALSFLRSTRISAFRSDQSGQPKPLRCNYREAHLHDIYIYIYTVYNWHHPWLNHDKR